MPHERPGKPLSESQLFEPRVREVNGELRMIGFNDSDGVYHALAEGEEFVQIKSADGRSRDTFIRTNDGTLVPVKIWITTKD